VVDEYRQTSQLNLEYGHLSQNDANEFFILLQKHLEEDALTHWREKLTFSSQIEFEVTTYNIRQCPGCHRTARSNFETCLQSPVRCGMAGPTLNTLQALSQLRHHLRSSRWPIRSRHLGCAR